MSEPRTEIRDGMRIDWDVPIRMDDGLVLRCDVYRPIEDGKYPVILSYGPYAKWLHFEQIYKTCWDKMCAEHPEVPAGSTNRYQNWEVVDPEKWVPDGYACVRVDSRGCGRSPGYVELWGPRETQDFAQCIEWAGVQPWSNGKVGLNGISYYAMNAFQVGALQPKHLAAICAWEGANDWYREVSHHGGILCTFLANWYDMQVKTVQHGVGTRGFRSPMTGDWVTGPETLSEEQLHANRFDFGRLALEHEFDDAFWKSPHARLVEDQGAASFQRQLGRPGTAPARQHRGLPQRRQQGEVARDARRRALDALLHRLRPRDAEEVLRLLPEGREERLGPAAESAAPDPPSRRALRRACRERMAARAHALDQAVPRRTRRHSFHPDSERRARV